LRPAYAAQRKLKITNSTELEITLTVAALFTIFALNFDEFVKAVYG